MLLRSLDLLFGDPAAFFALLPVLLVTVGLALVVGITVHEFSHALVAYRLGDATAKTQGRLSLNPLAHLDPMGTVMILLVGFGWGKPVPVNPHLLRKGGRTGMSLVAAAGPLANLVTAALLSIPMRIGWVPGLSFFSPLSFGGSATELLGSILGFVITINIILAVFNLLPIAPLDGFNVFLGVLPGRLSEGLARLRAYGPGILILLIMVDYISPISILWGIMGPLVDGLSLILVGRGLT